MRLINSIKIKDIIEYETLNEINILEELQSGSLFIVIDIIKLGNNCSEEEANNILNKALESMSLQDIIESIVYDLIGNLPDGDDDNNVEYKNLSFSNILEEFYTQIQTIDNTLSIGDFLNFSTRYMYTYADGLQKRYIHNKNKKYMEDFENVAMFMSAFTGNLKECPQLNEDGTIKKKSLIDKINALKMRG